MLSFNPEHPFPGFFDNRAAPIVLDAVFAVATT
jgi:hypothetical protein